VSTESHAGPDEVIAFWLAAGAARWFSPDAAFDAEIRDRFLPTYEAAAAGHMADWEETPRGALALLIVLDQFPRNMFRKTSRVYAADARARDIAERAVARGFDAQFGFPERQFFYLPFMHSEEMADQERCVALYRDAGDADGLKWAEHHADIVRRFGRFPHRNAILGRASTAEEQAYLDAGGFGGASAS
jgi:uncharacterized protein (DUF924 family)